MLYYVRKAEMTDLSEILVIIENARLVLANQGIPQWRNDDGPNEERLKEDIHLGEGYVLIEENSIMGYGTVTLAEQESYIDITNGNWEPSVGYVSIHRFTIDSRVKQKGMGQFFLGHLISSARAQNYRDIRIDTHPANIRMQKVIEKAGLIFKGNIVLNVSDGERKAYQVIL
ncbi:MAG: GNAT family N-acetyltransferase [Vagococcus sp.]|uniref:GNAT family N-acetyltransferase n=1 Tax=Vagococcus sp. TaxID=1933889 RepID=UPI002FC6B752